MKIESKKVVKAKTLNSMTVHMNQLQAQHNAANKQKIVFELH